MAASAARASTLLSADDFRTVGETIGGRTHWQADIARRLGYSKSLMTRYLNGSRVVQPEVANELRLAILEKMDELANLLPTDGLPMSDHPETKKGVQRLLNALSDLKTIA